MYYGDGTVDQMEKCMTSTGINDKNWILTLHHIQKCTKWSKYKSKFLSFRKNMGEYPYDIKEEKNFYEWLKHPKRLINKATLKLKLFIKRHLKVNETIHKVVFNTCRV